VYTRLVAYIYYMVMPREANTIEEYRRWVLTAAGGKDEE